MREPQEEGLQRKVHTRIPVVYDKEVHVGTVRVGDEEPIFEAREYIPSLDAYGRGLLLPLHRLEQFMDGCESVWHDHGEGEAGTLTEERKDG